VDATAGSPMDGFRVRLLLRWPAGCTPGPDFCAGGMRVFKRLYARHANTRKPLSVAVSTVAYKRTFHNAVISRCVSSRLHLIVMFWGDQRLNHLIIGTLA
jgi:hypothetical protein